jgi:hypothetical protein
MVVLESFSRHFRDDFLMKSVRRGSALVARQSVPALPFECILQILHHRITGQRRHLSPCLQDRHAIRPHDAIICTTITYACSPESRMHALRQLRPEQRLAAEPRVEQTADGRQRSASSTSPASSETIGIMSRYDCQRCALQCALTSAKIISRQARERWRGVRR